MSSQLADFYKRLNERMPDPYSRPFVCDGSPYKCEAFIVGINAATKLGPFSDYWSDDDGFDMARFRREYEASGKREGNRRVIREISRGFGGALETNVCLRPSRKAKQLTQADWDATILPFLFKEFRPKVVFVHAKEPIAYMEKVARCSNIDMEPQAAEWFGHRFWVSGRRGPLYTFGTDKAAHAYGQRLRALSRPC